MGTKRTDRTQATKDMRDYLLASGAHGLATTQGPNGSGLDWYALNGVVIIMQTMAGAEGFEVFAPVTTSNSIADTYAAIDRMEREDRKARDRQDCETPAGMERARAAARAMIAEMEQPGPACLSPFDQHQDGCACRQCLPEQPAPHSDRETLGDYINRVVDEPAPVEDEDVCITPHPYLSCQYCHAPAGDRQTKEDGICYDCKQKMVDEGHAWEENNERKLRQRRADSANLRAHLAATV